ncbi:MAG: chromosome segregation protein SMC [Deltaproteobacteria bacterium]|nr:chromosome segregation protein SMC [Deltaproteobacteria bacterium]
MHIQKVRIHGFKSFCDKTVFSFGRGLSGVVGPNGCGKSNVFDAVKWCLGEQSAKSLRGSSMSDVIFNGSKNRAPSSTAEVAIVFSKGEQSFPPPYHICDEIEIARVLHRTGGSEYLINKVRVRLKDIQDLFLDTGLHNRLYSFIEQGQIGMIVNARPAQTRLLFEEAAGISRFKLRKEQSVEKLKKVTLQLSEIDLMLGVQEKQLETLQRQVAQAEQYTRLKREEKELRIFDVLAKGKKLTDTLVERISKHESFMQEVQHLELINTRQEAFLHQARVSHSALFQRLSDVRTRYTSVEKELGSLQLRLELLEKELVEKKESLVVLKRTLKEDRSEQKKEEGALVRVVSERQAIWQSIQGEKVELQRLKSLVKGRKKELNQKYSALEKKKEEQRTLSKEIASISVQMNSIAMLLIRIENEQKERAIEQRNWIQEYAKIEKERSGLLKESDSLQADQEEIKKKEQEEQEKIGACDVERQKIQKERKAQEKERRILQKQQDTLQTEVSTLLRMQRDRVGFSTKTKEVLRRSDVYGTLLEELEVPQKYESILAVSLGEYIEAILVSSEHALQDIASKVQDRVHCFYPKSLSPYKDIGLIQRLHASEEAKKVLWSILGEHILIENIVDVPCEVTTKILCVNPPCVLHKGATTVGVPQNDTLMMLERSRNLKIKQAKIQGNNEHLTLFQDRILFLDQEDMQKDLTVKAMKKIKQELVANRQEFEKGLIRISTELRSLEKEEKAMKRRQDKLAGDQRRVVSEIEGQKEKKLKLAERKREVEKELFFTDDRVQELQLQVRRDQKDQKEREFTLQTRDTEFQIEQEKLHSKESLEKRLRETSKRLSLSIERKNEEEKTLSIRIERIRATLEKESAREDLLKDSCQTLADKSASMEKSYQEKQKEYSRVEKKFRDQIAKMEKKRGESKRKKDEISRMEQEMEQLANILQEDFSLQLNVELSLLKRDIQRAFMVDDEEYVIHYEEVSSSKKYTENRQLHMKKKEQLSKIRGINHLAVEQYHALDEEYKLKIAQREDIFESVSSLESFIVDLDQQCITRFSETYRHVNAHFQEMYPQLVGGGKSYLDLEDANDLLNTGVHIYARPPGKRMQQLSLLSGGEKAMVAISLLFSLFKEKPSPFCLLDEVDAPLDEGNGARFNMMLKEMSLTSQFIVITHNKKTMEAMDTLYGVSMPKPGISQVGSVRLR